jgi:hypothetical protein
MPKQIKIVRFQLSKSDFTNSAERELEGLLNQGFTIVANGGAGQHGYIVLQREVQQQGAMPPQHIT